MTLDVRIRKQALNPSLDRYVHRRLEFALRRFAGAIGHIDVRVSDINGPRGGEDKQCRLSIHLDGRATVVVDAVADRGWAAVDRAAAKATRRLARGSDRRTDVRRVRNARTLRRPAAGANLPNTRHYALQR